MTPKLARRVAAVALRTGWTPRDVLETPPEVLDEVLAILDERDQRQRRDQMRERLRGKVKGGG